MDDHLRRVAHQRSPVILHNCPQPLQPSQQSQYETSTYYLPSVPSSGPPERSSKHWDAFNGLTRHKEPDFNVSDSAESRSLTRSQSVDTGHNPVHDQTSFGDGSVSTSPTEGWRSAPIREGFDDGPILKQRSQSWVGLDPTEAHNQLKKVKMSLSTRVKAALSKLFKKDEEEQECVQIEDKHWTDEDI